MENKNLILLTFLIGMSGFSVIAQNVGINTTGISPNASAGLDIDFKNKGFLMPRLTTAQRDAITSPAEGLMIYNTETKCYEAFNPSMPGWKSFGCITPDGTPAQPSLWSVGYVHCSTPTEIVDVVSTTGKTWMDRNLGASQAATASDDATSYGDLFQWGRFADGHQCRNSSTTTTLSSTDSPGHSDFILSLSVPTDWRSVQNDNLWQGVNGMNNPCPSGYRLPTMIELDDETNSWSLANAIGAFASPLALPMAGYRSESDGALTFVDSQGFYWASTIYDIYAVGLQFYSGGAAVSVGYRAYGLSVRCIKN